MKTLDGISIVIATKGRVKLLGDLLESVYEARSNFSGESEVILVDDSNEADVKNIDILCKNYDAKRIYFSPSVAEKRNVGARHSKYEIILFLDSDCIATPNLLNEHFNLYTEDRIGGVAGLLEFVGEDTWFWKAVEKSPFVICFGLPRWLNEVPWTPTANCSIRKEVFFLVNGFDRSFPDKPGGEDVDLGLRVTKKGYVFKCTKEGLVYHSKETWIPVKDMVKRLWHYGCANYYLADKHPEYTMKIMPRKSVLYLVGFAVIILIALLRIDPFIFMLIPMWIVADLSLTSLFINMFAKYKRTSFLHQFVVQLLMMDNEVGYVFTCIKKGKIEYIFKDVVYFDGQIDGILDNGSIVTWSNFFSFLFLYGTLLLIR